MVNPASIRQPAHVLGIGEGGLDAFLGVVGHI
jgi:hypothetical protein